MMGKKEDDANKTPEHQAPHPETSGDAADVTDEDAAIFCQGYNDALVDPDPPTDRDPVEREYGELQFNYPELWAEYHKVSDTGDAPDDDRWEELNAELTDLTQGLWRERNAKRRISDPDEAETDEVFAIACGVEAVLAARGIPVTHSRGRYSSYLTIGAFDTETRFEVRISDHEPPPARQCDLNWHPERFGEASGGWPLVTPLLETILKRGYEKERSYPT